MAFRSIARFGCDGCKVIEKEVEVPSDLMQANVPRGWLRVELRKTDAALDVLDVRFFCRHCAPLVESYLRGAPTKADR